jgi:hypothetical protein
MLILWNLVLVHLEIVLVSVQYRCMVCAELPRALKSFCAELPQALKSCFGSFGDSVSVVAR